MNKKFETKQKTVNNLEKDSKKVILGQFFTRDSIWLKDHIVDFIVNSKSKIAYDPFAGEGHLLQAAKKIGLDTIKGLDIDNELKWDQNDSLKSIPHIEEAIIITNPPYIAKYSASRKKVENNVKMYFENSKYDDIYLIALDKMLDAQDNVVAIIPETFINSNFQSKNRLVSITILEENPFDDTDTPVCVVCFDKTTKKYSEIKIFKNDDYLGTLEYFESLRLTPKNDIKIKFNSPAGWLALRAVDTTNPNEKIKFDFKNNIEYDWEKGIKVSSRLLTLIDVVVPDVNREEFIIECNRILNNIRIQTSDVILSPFKGNMKNGKRRRRLDYKTARSIIEKAYKETVLQGSETNEEFRLL